MIEGHIKWYDKIIGYGFIYSDELEKDIFVHKSEMPDIEVTKEHILEFDVEEGEKGLVAKNVQIQ